ncbi:Paramyosin like, partial [Actinidia chinensis var. chinensis]
MDLSQEIEDYIRDSIDYSLGLPVSTNTLESKLRASEEAREHLRDQYLYLQIKLKEKDEVIERARAESSMNAQALKRFVEENQKLAKECTNLLSQCTRWEKECSLYDRDREALMDFGNEADERAKEAEIRVNELEGEIRTVTEELQFYKHHFGMHPVDSSAEGSAAEQFLLESLVTTLVGDNEVAQTAHAFLEANCGVDLCQSLLMKWNSVRPSTQKVLALAAEVKTLQKEKEHLRINLTRAEEEVNVLFQENKVLDKENKKLTRHHKERWDPSSGEKHTGSASAKGSKRKSSPKTCSPTDGKIDFTDVDSPRKPLSSLQHNSPESRMYK